MKGKDHSLFSRSKRSVSEHRGKCGGGVDAGGRGEKDQEELGIVQSQKCEDHLEHFLLVNSGIFFPTSIVAVFVVA